MAEVLSTHQVASESVPGRTYTVTEYDTHTECSCRAWQYSKLADEERVCKHVESITGRLRKGDAQLTDAESAWVIRKLLGVTDKSFQSIADSVELELEGDKSLSDYERNLASAVLITLRGSKRWEDDEAPGPDAQQALVLIRSALKM